MKLEKNINKEKKERHGFKLIRSNRYSALTEAVTKANSKIIFQVIVLPLERGESIFCSHK